MEASDMPETAQYRVDVTKWCNFCLTTIQKHPDDPEAVEDAIQMGQVEELIDAAECEMIALQTYVDTRMWEVVAQMNPTLDFEPDPTADPTEDPNFAEQMKRGMEEQRKAAEKEKAKDKTKKK